MWRHNPTNPIHAADFAPWAARPRLRAWRFFPFLLASCLLLGAGCDASQSDSIPGPASGTPGASADLAGAAPIADGSAPPGFGPDHPVISPNAQIETHLLLIEDLATPRHPGDGKGRAWLESVESIDSGSAAPVWNKADAQGKRPLLTVGTTHRFTIGFEVAAPGIDAGGLIFLSAEPFWDWSESQTASPMRAGHTVARSNRPDRQLEPEGRLGFFRVVGGRLEAGDRLEFVYGAGPAGARVDRYAERGARIWIGVDADGDGVRAWLDDLPRVDIQARPATRMLAFAPAVVRPGEPFSLALSLVDDQGNAATWPAAPSPASPARSDTALGVPLAVSVSLDSFRPEWAEWAEPDEVPLQIPSPAPIEWDAQGRPAIRLEAPDRAGTLRLNVLGLGPLEGFSSRPPPIRVDGEGLQLRWADLHGHSQLSDGTGTAEDYFRYARDVARLDVVALTDHDHWGLEPLDAEPNRFARILATGEAFHEPGRFVTLPGYEWTSWLHGHRHVLFFDSVADSGPAPQIFSALDPATDRPDELWSALRGRAALTFSHHSAGDPVATNWYYPPDPVLEPIAEIASVHGSSEAIDSPDTVAGAIPGQFVRDVLMRGAQLGFVGSGDSHDGHPGLAQLAGDRGGLAGLFVDRFDRAGALDALRARRTFATNGIRPFFEVSIDRIPMGGTLPQHDPGTASMLRIRYEATTPVERIELIRSGGIARLVLDPPGAEQALSIDIEREILPLRKGEFHYVRVLESGGGLAWSSPIYASAGSSP